jgi:hypothetical protein
MLKLHMNPTKKRIRTEVSNPGPRILKELESYDKFIESFL